MTAAPAPIPALALVESPDSASGVPVLVELALSLPALEVVVADDSRRGTTTPSTVSRSRSVGFESNANSTRIHTTRKELPFPPVPLHTIVEYSAGNQLAYKTGANVARVYPDGQHVASVSIPVPAKDVTQHTCQYPVGEDI
ncbi:hypothetical protein BKA65DRAFT_549280 [Rhexocercosporidium sp. MPI-PUGE-AT-0058]|nr:hypothetical protein BKA65DRAFT_549280 [Rhexocercosporidium sp. MPI-PUGE-AT-0058]